MLLSDLITENDDLPLLARLILGRIKAGDTIRVDVAMPSERSDWKGLLQNVRLGSPMKMNPAAPILIPRLFIHWRQDWRKDVDPGHSTSQWVRADSFDDRFELVKDESSEADWVLKYRPKRVNERLVDSKEPLLVTLVDQRLQAGDKVLLSITIKRPQFDGSVVEFKHAGLVTGIAELRMKSAQQRRLVGSDYGVCITFEKAGAKKEDGYKGFTEVILPVDDFDDRYTLEKVKSFGQDAWMLTDV